MNLEEIMTKQIKLPEWYENFRWVEIETALALKMPGYHFEYQEDSDANYYNFSDVDSLMNCILKHRKAEDIQYTLVGGDDYSLLIIAIKD